MKSKKLKIPTEQDYMKAEELLELHQKDGSDDYFEFCAQFNWEPVVFEENGKVGLKTPYGELIIPAMIDDYYLLSRNSHKMLDRLTVVVGDKYGIIKTNGSGTWIVEPEYDYIGFPDAITHVRKEDKSGLLNISTNELVAPLEYDNVYEDNGFFFLNGIGVLIKGDKIAIVMDYGKVSKAIFDDIEQPVEGVVKVKMNGEWGYIDEEGDFTTNIDDAYFSGEDF
jgi:hypothetical protein